MVDQFDNESKSLPPTQKKIHDTLKQGNVIISREIYNFCIIFAAFCLVAWIVPYTLPSSLKKLSSIIEHAWSISYPYTAFMQNATYIGLIFLLPIFFLLIILIILANFIHHGKFNVAFTRIKIDFSNLSPIKGFKKLISLNSLFEAVKNIFKIGIILLFVYLAIKAQIEFYSPGAPLSSFFEVTHSLIKNLFFASIIFLLCLSAIDYSYKRHVYMKKLMMSKRELKEELRNTEGNPEIKSYIRSKRFNSTNTRLLQSVKKATILIVSNDNHIVALQYTEGQTLAPIVVAKEFDLLALQLKNIAIDSSVPIIRDTELAKDIYYNVKLYEQIHEVYFASVAKAIASALALKTR
jgi:flagellar biosynthesis protein FlhB